MKERPIIFSAPMVRAILDGRKTQTRRIVKDRIQQMCNGNKPWHFGVYDKLGREFVDRDGDPIALDDLNRYEAGDHLWVREAWTELIDTDHRSTGEICYHATETRHIIKRDDDGFPAITKAGYYASPWRPSIHMPRWASRITLEITDVRVERVQEISNEDADAEGVRYFDSVQSLSRNQFRDAWRKINGASSWDENPWVWVLEFRRIK